MNTKSKRESKRKFKHLSLDDRIKIEIHYSQGKSMTEIAKIVGKGRDKSTISREINGRPHKGRGRYKAYIAHNQALARDKNRGKRERLKNDGIRAYTKEKLKLGWSPEQVSIRLPKEHRGQSISHEAIYQFIYAQVRRGGNGKLKEGCEDLRQYLARRHTRRSTKGARRAQRVERVANLPSIEQRPRSVDGRKEVGHFEDDTLVSRQSAERLKSINERTCGVLFLSKMKNGTTLESTKAVLERLQKIPSPYLKTLTRDRGTENLGWKEIEKETPLKVYFAHAYCSQERGSNENLNGLVRRFFPKKTDFSKVTDEEVRMVEYLINTRPRKRFGGKTPLEVLFEKTGVAITY